MTEALARFLMRQGCDVTIAYYATLTDDPDLVVPSWELLSGKKPDIHRGLCFKDIPSVTVGCRFPELEFPYYWATDRWKKLIGAYDRHIAVGGTVLVANTLVVSGVPHFVWCASAMLDDRIDRRARMPAARRVFDSVVVGSVQRAMEKRVLRGCGLFLAISRYTRASLVTAGVRPEMVEHVPMPVNLKDYIPSTSSPPTAQIGFAGRIDDPRKNIGLMLRSVAVLARRSIPVRLKLTGDPSTALNELASTLNIADRIEWTGWLDPQSLSHFYRSLDVFVFSSGQEGLGISGIQAMACGVPVVSTRCGGPEDYVIDGVTGKLTGHTPGELADGIGWIISDRERRNDLALKSRALVEKDYSQSAFEENIARAWEKTWGEALG
ncbi:MAG: D-inositol 3-phosphate glycosyltransferase [Alphaproteobacteria bacterium MarineAlpha11_Bin1]|nr:MAG: D-inositol 3-phosphate glycosyltransferase [Alphaproteobacteria bacterium MarineAlpha11_Bin1]|tara:strand:- start:20385 stop:21524 length:1140 start_codon:yes stop_codon:yes gene_type:complete